MSEPFDAAAGHRHFSADYFNRVWDLLAKEDRSAEDDQRMLSMCHASIAHWRDRDDCGAQQLSIGYWQLSRVYAVLGKAIPARGYGELCLEASNRLGPFYIGFAYEALARAEEVAGDLDACALQLGRARAQLEEIDDEQERQMLAADLDSLGRTSP